MSSTRTPCELLGGRIDTSLAQGMEESVSAEACFSVDRGGQGEEKGTRFGFDCFPC